MGLFSKNKDVVCKCKKIEKSTIIDAIKNGADTYEKVKEVTGAGSGFCKGKKCKEQIEELINENK